MAKDGDENLSSFKASDLQKPGKPLPKSAAPGGDKPASEERPSLGFVHIEEMLETESPEGVSERINALMESLHQFADKASTNRDKANAKKAIVAVEHTADLLDYLYQTKEAMIAAAKGQGPSK